MAANSIGRAIAGALGKRFADQIWPAASRDPSPFASSVAVSIVRRRVHVSSYDKNYEEQVHPSVVPDDVIQSKSDKYWGPHPKTGVFGPTEQHSATGDSTAASPSNGGGPSVLDQTAWFRPLEDVDKPPHA